MFFFASPKKEPKNGAETYYSIGFRVALMKLFGYCAAKLYALIGCFSLSNCISQIKNPQIINRISQISNHKSKIIFHSG
jgi:hypothetical protein